jgi:hypothetical protein
MLALMRTNRTKCSNPEHSTLTTQSRQLIKALDRANRHTFKRKQRKDEQENKFFPSNKPNLLNSMNLLYSIPL